MKIRTDLQAGNFITKAADLSCQGLQNFAKFVNEAERQVHGWGAIMAEKTVQANQKLKNDFYPG
jgi:hypothetical protein